MEPQVQGESSKCYIIREGAAAWSNRRGERVVSAWSTRCGERVVSTTLSGRERLHGATGAGKESLALHYQRGSGCIEQQARGESS
jgi:hypothetical protein